MADAARSIADRARSSAGVDPQDGMFDQVLENDLLERALEKRLAAAEALKKPKKDYSEADEQAKGIIAALELEEGTVVRCGRFRIKTSLISGGHRSFDVGDRVQSTIALIKD